MGFLRRISSWGLIVLISLFVVTSGVFRGPLGRSSYFNTKSNYFLPQHAFQSFRLGSLLSCAQMCLSKPKCRSFNYENNSKVKEGSLCELNDASSDRLSYYQGYIHGWFQQLLYHTYIFTTLDGTGSRGPKSTAKYTGTSLQGDVRLNNGTQIWKVPHTGVYVITSIGASGGNGTDSGCKNWTLGGKGASITGTFMLQKGTILKIIVGQQGLQHSNFPQRPGGGGGGTFVATIDDKPLIIAGGGGGGGIGCRSYFVDGDPGQAGPNGTRGGGYGGSGGSITIAGIPGASGMLSNGGAGFYGDGKSNSGGTNSRSFIHGGEGGVGITETGGFGGGGYGWTHAGGGGGYSGGGVIGNHTSGFAGGGGSYNRGSSQINKAAVNKGHGKVIIKNFS